MKTILYYLFVFTLATTFLTACKKMDATYKDFIVSGGITYPGKVTSAKIFAGQNRVKISWLNGASPSVIKAKIYWNSYADSVEVAINQDEDVTSKIIENLPQGTYTFIVKTFDKKGNSSIPVELLGTVYGDIYQESLLARPLRSSVLYTDRVEIEWGVAHISGGAYASQVKYIDVSDKERIRQFPVSEEKSTISDMKKGSPFEYRTVFLPDTLSIDTFYTAFQANLQSSYAKQDWSVVAFSSVHPDANPDRNKAANFFDGNPTTRWHTHATTSVYPHFVTIDMKSNKTIKAVEVFRTAGDARGCKTFQLWISQDNVTYTKLGGVFNFNVSIDAGQMFQVSSPFPARYLKFEGLTGSEKYMNMGDMSVYGN